MDDLVPLRHKNITHIITFMILLIMSLIYILRLRMCRVSRLAVRRNIK